MKKLHIILIAFVLGFSSTLANGLEIRGFGGLNVMQLSSDQTETIIDEVLHGRTVTGRPGFQFGAAVQFGQNFYVEPGIQYSILSSKVVDKNTVDGTEFTDETTLNTFSIPLKVGYRMIDPSVESIFNVRVFAGVSGHHVTSVNHNVDEGKKSKPHLTMDTDDFHNLILNSDLGIGIDVLFLYLDVGYQIGLTPVFTGSDDKTSSAFYSNLGVRIAI